MKFYYTRTDDNAVIIIMMEHNKPIWAEYMPCVSKQKAMECINYFMTEDAAKKIKSVFFTNN